MLLFQDVKKKTFAFVMIDIANGLATLSAAPFFARLCKPQGRPAKPVVIFTKNLKNIALFVGHLLDSRRYNKSN